MGYMGKFLEVNLSNNSLKEHPLDVKLAKKYIGGKGLGAKILYDNLSAGVDPFSPDNIILFMTGPLSGTTVQTSGRWCIVTKSPHTGIFNDSHIGGKFGHRLKRAGSTMLWSTEEQDHHAIFTFLMRGWTFLQQLICGDWEHMTQKARSGSDTRNLKSPLLDRQARI